MTLMDDEIEKLVSDGVSPINSNNKFFFLDFFGLKRNHDCFMNFFAHENLQDVTNLPTYDVSDVFNKDPALYKTSFDEHGHVIKIIEMPPCIFIDQNQTLLNLMKQADGSYKLPSELSYIEYESYCVSNNLLVTNVIYLLPKTSKETSIQTIINNEIVTINNANNGYYEYIITSITWNNLTGKYDVNWEMLGGKEGEGSSSGTNISFSNLVEVSTLSESSDATASVEILSQTEESIIYQLHLGIPKGATGDNIELQVNDATLQYKKSSDSSWTDLYDLTNLKGVGITKIEQTESSTESSGKNTITITLSDSTTYTFNIYNGAKGADGTSVNIINTLSSTNDLPISGNNNGDGYLVNGYLWIYTGATTIDENNIKGFTNVGKIQGPQGEKGTSITSVESIQTEGVLTSLKINYSDGTYDNISVGDIKGQDGNDGADGTNGKNIEINSINVNTIESTESASSEITLNTSLSDNTKNVYDITFNIPKGEKGADGQDGSDGINGIDGKSISNAEINSSGHLILTFNDTTELDAGLVKGADGSNGQDGIDGKDGTNGIDGREIELQTTETMIQWKYVGEETWTDLIALSLLKGTDGQDGTNGIDGREIELQVNETSIQWKYTNSEIWTDLIALSLLKGTDGQDGTNGVDGNGIESIVFTSSDKGDTAGIAGATDTYTITFTDNTTKTFTVYNGKDGSDSSITIDDAMSETSTNAVQNKVIKAYVDGLVGDIQTVLASLATVTEEGGSV